MTRKSQRDTGPIRGQLYLREWRKYKKLTQAAVAERLEVEQGTLSRVERRDLPVNLDFLERLAAIYGVDVSDFLSVNPLKPDPPKLAYSKLRHAPADLQKRALNLIEALLKEAS